MWDAEAFEREGYAVVPGVLGQAQIDGLIASIQRIPVGGAALDRGGHVYATRNLFEQVPVMRDLAGSGPIRGLVERVLGLGAFVVRGLLFDKTIQANWTVPWHQDLSIAVKARLDVAGFGPWTRKAGVTHVQPPTSILERMLTVRLQLDEGRASNGPLRVVPGSHGSGRLGAEGTRDWLERGGMVTCPVPAGGALVMRPLLLHASSPSDDAETGGHRRVIHFEFACDPLPGGLEWYEHAFATSGMSRR